MVAFVHKCCYLFGGTASSYCRNNYSDCSLEKTPSQADVRSSHNMAMSAMRASISTTLSAPASAAGITGDEAVVFLVEFKIFHK